MCILYILVIAVTGLLFPIFVFYSSKSTNKFGGVTARGRTVGTVWSVSDQGMVGRVARSRPDISNATNDIVIPRHNLGNWLLGSWENSEEFSSVRVLGQLLI